MLRVRDLSISIGTPNGFTDIVSSVSFEIGKGRSSASLASRAAARV